VSLIETIFWGAVSGILTTVLLWLFGLLVQKVFIPWYQEFIYKGVDLKGTWNYHIQYESGVTYSCQLDLKQSAHKITGLGSMRVENSDNDYVQNLSIEGETWEGFLILNMRSTSNSSLSFVSGLFKVEERGAKLSGSWAYRSRVETVSHEDLCFERVNG
jgi:hypothetical protein